MKVVCMPTRVWMCIRPNAASSVRGALPAGVPGWNCSGHPARRHGDPPACTLSHRPADRSYCGFHEHRRRVTKRARARVLPLAARE